MTEPMHAFHCFFREQLPVPGTHAPVVRYPACEWRVSDHAEEVARHPMNRFVCSWLTSDVSDLARCDEVLQAIAHIESQQRATWFADGDAFCVDFTATGVQFNPSHVGPEDIGWWDLAAARFELAQLKPLLLAWREFLVQCA
jgi:hypothetical protein